MKDVICKLKSLWYENQPSCKDNCTVLFMCHDHDLGEMFKGKPYSKIIDYLCDFFTTHHIKSLRFALPFSLLVGKHAYNEPFSANRLLFIAKIIDRVFKTKGRHEKLVYKRIIRSFNCQYIMGIGLPPSLCAASNECNVVTIEVLHALGVAHVHLTWKDYDKQMMPDGIIVFDEVSQTLLSRHMPNTYLKRADIFWLNKEDKTFENDFSHYMVGIREKYPKIVLVTLQWGYDGENEKLQGILANGIIHECLLEAIHQTKEEVFWILRLHPVQLRGVSYQHHRDFVQKLSKKYDNCEASMFNECSLADVLPHVHGHITMCSSAAYEAKEFGVQTLFLCPSLLNGNIYSDYFLDLEKSGYAKKTILHTRSIMQWLNTMSIFEKKEADIPASMNGIYPWMESIKHVKYKK